VRSPKSGSSVVPFGHVCAELADPDAAVLAADAVSSSAYPWSSSSCSFCANCLRFSRTAW